MTSTRSWSCSQRLWTSSGLRPSSSAIPSSIGEATAQQYVVAARPQGHRFRQAARPAGRQVEQQGMARIVGDGALGQSLPACPSRRWVARDRTRPHTARSRATRWWPPSPTCMMPSYSVAFGVLERPRRTAQAQAEPRTSKVTVQGFSDWDICQAISATLPPCGEGHRTCGSRSPWRCRTLAFAGGAGGAHRRLVAQP